MNSQDQSRPLDGRSGHDPFDGTDPSYSCDGLHRNSSCVRLAAHHKITVVPANIGHNELLGGHGNDTINAGPAGDVIWGDYKPSGQPGAQHDTLIGAAGNDFIYASHGLNAISAGPGNDFVKAHFCFGRIDCGLILQRAPELPTLPPSRVKSQLWKLHKPRLPPFRLFPDQQ